MTYVLLGATTDLAAFELHIFKRTTLAIKNGNLNWMTLPLSIGEQNLTLLCQT
jgi:hypothetical protein